MNKKLLRIVLSPFGLIISITKIVNSSSRDIVNKLFYHRAKVGTNVCITSDTIIGKQTLIERNSIINHCKIGKYSMIHMNSRLENVTIGNYCSIAHNVMIGLGEHPINNLSTSSFFYDSTKKILNNGFDRFEEVKIGHDVWIGAGAIIMNGVTIGNGVIVAAGAVVTKDIPDFSIVGGVPAKLIKYRNITDFKEAIDNEWWQYDLEEVKNSFN